MTTLYDVKLDIDTDKPRAANYDEVEFYLRWLARCRGVIISADACFGPKGITVGGVTVLGMPGYGVQDVVTCEILDDAGEVVRTMPLPTDKRGKLPMTAAQVKEWSGLKATRKPRAAAAPVVIPVEAETVPQIDTSLTAPMTSPAADVDALLDLVTELAARVATLERRPVAAPTRARTEREARAVQRAWDMRKAMRERADLDRRALEATSAAYHKEVAAREEAEFYLQCEREDRARDALKATATVVTLHDKRAATVKRFAAIRHDLRIAQGEVARLRPVAAAIAAAIAAQPAPPPVLRLVRAA
jgi:hypothetical protein